MVRVSNEVCPSNATERRWFLTPRTSVEASSLHLRSSLLVPQAVMSLWSLMVIFAPIARGEFKPKLGFQASTSSCHALYKSDNIGYVEVPEDYLYNTNEYINAYVAFGTYVCRTWEHIRIVDDGDRGKLKTIPYPRLEGRLHPGQSESSGRSLDQPLFLLRTKKITRG